MLENKIDPFAKKPTKCDCGRDGNKIDPFAECNCEKNKKNPFSVRKG